MSPHRTENTALANTESGFDLFDRATGIVLVENMAKGNQVGFLFISKSGANQVTENQGQANTVWDAAQDPSSLNTYVENVFKLTIGL